MDAKSVVSSAEWNTFAPSFIQLASNGPGVEPAARMVATANAMSPLAKATVVVDMGCGPGQVTNAVLKSHAASLPPSARVVAADINEGMLQQVKTRREREIALGNDYWAFPRLETLECDVNNCSSLKDDSVSHMLSNFVISLLPDPAGAVQSIKRVLTPGGIFAMSAVVTSEWLDLMMVPAKVRPEFAMPPLPSAWSSAEGLVGEFEKAGFNKVRTEEVEHYLPFEDHDELARFVLLKFPLTKRWAEQMTAEEVVKVKDLMVEQIKEKYPQAPATLVGQCVIVYGTK